MDAVPFEPAQRAKQAAREGVWRRLENDGASPPGRAWGRIPDFHGSEEAAARLSTLEEWQCARIVKSNPDQAQLPVRAKALREDKLVYMAVPKMATLKPFYRLNPRDTARIGVDAEELAVSRVAREHASTVGPEEMANVDFIVCGSAAVDRDGVRVGKGAGYSDLEVGLLTIFGVINEHTTIVTTVHDLQVVDESLPHTAHDFSVDYIVTPTSVIPCGLHHRPEGIGWEHLQRTQLGSIPILQQLAGPPTGEN